jgi:tetratricopeptide (TPR) repeat protein
VQSRHAWLFARAAATGAAPGPGDSADIWLFARAFADVAQAKAFFAERGWDLTDAEYAYLERAAALAPGSFPREFGREYPARGEGLLLDRSRRREVDGDVAGARSAAEVLLRLAPLSGAAHDRLASLLHRSGEIDRAIDLVAGWCRLAPDDYLPLVRQAVLEQERGNLDRRAEAISRALERTNGRLRAAVAYLGARLALRQQMNGAAPASARNGTAGSDGLHTFDDVRRLLELCLEEQPDHAESQWCLAALQSLAADQRGLAARAAAMDRTDVRDGRFHYLAAVSHLAAGQPGKALELVRRAAYADTALASDAYYLLSRVHAQQGDGPEAREALEHAAVGQGPSVANARTLLGRMCFTAGQMAEATRWWERIDPRDRAAHGLDATLRQTALLAALEDYNSGRFEEATERFRQAERLGARDPRIGSLLAQALVQAGRKLLREAAAEK